VDAWRDIRLRARDCRAEALKHSNGEATARAIVDGALKANDLQLNTYPSGVGVSKEVRGFLERDACIVNIAAGQGAEDEVVVIAHEIGHFKLHLDPRSEVTVIAPGLGGDPVDSGAGRVQGYSPHERQEVQADIFAGELLCPSDWLRTELDAGKSPTDIAKVLGLPHSLVMNQTIRAVLLPPLRPIEPGAARQATELDATQSAASRWDNSPLLVNAGPGTGKTRTLIDRVTRKLEAGSLPGSFLALTFSNKAAEEMRERLVTSGHDVVEMWVGTFHAFGLEIVQKWPAGVGRTQAVKILDQTGQLALLEQNLHRLTLRHYQNLFEPAYELVAVLRAISRCKDELVSPETYRAEAEKAAAEAVTDEEIERAEKALEIAHVYQVYQQALEEADAVDFGDLIVLATRILEENPAVLGELRGRYQHILVDEYQDVNFASARLLKVLCGPNADLWVVADQRQSIYRFRGAEPSNLDRFADEFGGQSLALGTNYRSGAPVVRAFQAFAGSMQTGARIPKAWQPNRGETGSVRLTVAPTVSGEAAAIRDRIYELRDANVPLRDQVLLARSHLTLSRLTSVLEQLGVPLLYLGDLFERSEVRDLLSLLSIDAERGGVGLLRVAQLPEYAVPEADILAFIRWCIENDLEFITGLQRLDDLAGLTTSGRAGLARLGDHLRGVTRTTPPWAMLTSWLFERSDYLTPLLKANDAKARQQLIAIYQLLKVCSEFMALGESNRRRFLERIRRIEALNEDTAYRAVSSEAADLDAVRVMTIHGSKGLEFRAVHLPAIATRYMPSNPHGNRCPPPSNLSHLSMDRGDHDAEEECLFFVALSRAQDHLSLSRAERYTSQNSSPSRFLSSLSLPERRSGDHQVSAAGRNDPVPPARQTYTERELTIYGRCPLRYRYEVVSGLAGAKDSTPYVRFHGCVHLTIEWLEEQRSAGVPASEAQALDRLAAVWEQSGPKYGFADFYRQQADRMVSVVALAIMGETGAYDSEEWAVQLDGKTISLTPDRVIIGADGTVRVQRIRTGRKTKSENQNEIYALIRRGAAQRYPGRKIVVETFYPASGERAPLPAVTNDMKALKTYSDAIRAIEGGEFPPTTDTRYCPSCPCYLICGV
jgi:DNA helicase II / ATP-dependent DNA helicase PcrA